MKLAILGYGKMGQFVEQMALERNHDIVLTLDQPPKDQPLKDILAKSGAEVIIEFTQPDAAIANMKAAFEAKIPIVVGTTGWYEEMEAVKIACETHEGALLYAGNFSLGVNMFFHLNEVLAKMMKAEDSDYWCEIFERHHTEKKDHPSGTAYTLVKSILEASEKYQDWKDYPADAGKQSKAGEVPIYYERAVGEIGMHEVTYKSEIDEIKIKHQAFNRKGFAQGAVLAAEWLKGKKGLFTMKDILNF